MLTHKFTRSIQHLFITSLSLAIVSCSSQNTTEGGEARLDEIRASGELRVGYLTWDPAVIKNVRTGELEGIYPDLINQIGNETDLEIKWVETSLSSFSAGLFSDQFDFSVGPTFITIPRSYSVSFTQPIGFVGNSAVVQSNSELTFQTMEDLNRPTVRVAVLQGQAMEKYLREYAPEAKLVVIPGADLTAPLVSVSSGKADIGFMNSLTVSRYAEKHPELKIVYGGENQIAPTPLAWVTRQEDHELRDFLNSSIDYLRYTGRLKEVQNQYPYKLIYRSNELIDFE